MHAQPSVGDIVISLCGHDAGKPFVVTAQVSAKFVLIADGEGRTVENPKLKRIRHLRVAEPNDGEVSPTNAALKKRLKKFIRDRRLYAEE